MASKKRSRASKAPKRKRVAPVGVKIISILYYITAFFSVFSGLFLLFGSKVFSSIVPFTGSFASLSVLGGLASIVLGVLAYIIGKNLWAGINWARIVVLVIAVLGLLGEVIAIFSSAKLNVVSLIINAIIAWYLTYNNEVKKYFS